MKKQICVVALGCGVLAVGLLSQTTPTVVQWKSAFAPQQTEVYGESDGEYRLLLNAGPGAVQAISGRQFSATETSKTVQTLGDGTEITHSDTRKLYRDVLGRVRTESTAGQQTLVVIRDQVNGFTLRLSPEEKTAVRVMLAGRGGRGVMAADSGNVTMAYPAPTGKKSASKRSQTQVTNEDLGVQTVNGVPALGTRHTQTIPAGQIGNNRDINVVNERWFSEELQMLVKTVNSDPRYGVTTYELTDISRDNPDPSLFQLPAGYTVTEGGRGARGGGFPGTVVTIPAEVTVKKNQ